ncbi:carboxymethylenebutenolidase [Deinobacterium chartae]|uniref:Carboxymethylenebutenolidase n=1 Tax=Deinobacterium chartae TaxID=521158 RepID=A0A841I6D3_9DEIO|nr:dienelactone hydrolase family protein [Deinobacterium chartae]MBB6099462.1 carboxymethylenebutenolidase [Deinobacterium chartae]
MNVSPLLVKLGLCLSVLSAGCAQVPNGLNNAPIHAPEALEAAETEIVQPLSVASEGELNASAAGYDMIDVTIPAELHAQKLPIPAKLARPKGASPNQPRATVMVLHGSGGLFKTPDKKDRKPGNPVCKSEMSSQFVNWTAQLTSMGYNVLLPSSYSARGFCDKHDDTKRMPKSFDTDEEQVLGRLYDVDASSRYLCGLSDVDCNELGLLGWSQGGTATMVALHWQMDRAIEAFRKEHRKDIDFEIVGLKPGRPKFKLGVAYYPGCGFDGFLTLSTRSKTPAEDKYFPTAPLTVLHGTKDSLLERCSTEYARGERETQIEQVAAYLKVPNPYEITVFKGAGHGFDGSDSKGSKGSASSDKTASREARKIAVAKFTEYLK